jgi:hypothetical protein
MTGSGSMHPHTSDAPGTDIGARADSWIIAGRGIRWRCEKIQSAVTPLGFRPRTVTADPLPSRCLLLQESNGKITLCTWKTDHQ